MGLELEGKEPQATTENFISAMRVTLIRVLTFEHSAAGTKYLTRFFDNSGRLVATERSSDPPAPVTGS